MVPVRWLAEALGAEVRWNAPSRIVTVETKNRGYENPYSYSRLREEAGSPESVLQSYFEALDSANNLTLEQAEAAGGSIGLGLEPYPTAYGYWSREWQAEHPYDQFLDSWSGTARVELLKLIEAETRDGEATFFVETKHLEAAGKHHLLGEFYYKGFFTVKHGEDGWRIAEGSLEPQNLAFRLGGHQPWREDPFQVALVLGWGKEMDEKQKINHRIVYHTDDYVTVDFLDNTGDTEASFDLVRPEEGFWLILAERYAERST